MIIDMHRHLWSLFERYPRAAEIARRGGAKEALVEDLPIVPDWEQTGRDLIKEMDESGIDISVIFMADYALRLGDGIFTAEGENRIHVELMKQYTDRIIAYFGIDPRRKGAADSFETAVTEWGVRGLKMHPTVGYFPHDRAAYPLYEICQSKGLPVTFHTGPMPSPLFSRYTQPLHFDEVAADFPDMTIVMAHAGQELWPEALNVARMKPNIILELSMWQPKFKYLNEFLFAIDRMRDTIGIERITWGSDFPGLRNVMPLKKWVDIFKQLPSLGEEHGFKFDDLDVQALMGGNAARILNL